MIPHQFFYQLVLLGLLWLFVMLHYASQPSPSCHGASAPATRSHFLASPASPPVPPVRRPTRPHPNCPVVRHPASCPRGDGHARWTPRSISVPIRTATIAAGWDGAISVRMVIRAAALGDSCIAANVRGIFH